MESLLVYLDTAQIRELQRKATTEPGVAAGFLERWSQLNCRLALSGVHIQEFAQGTDDQSLRDVVRLIGRFPSVSLSREFGTANGVAEFELGTQFPAFLFGKSNMQEGGAPDASLRNVFFPPGNAQLNADVVLRDRDRFIRNRNFAQETAKGAIWADQQRRRLKEGKLIEDDADIGRQFDAAIKDPRLGPLILSGIIGHELAKRAGANPRERSLASGGLLGIPALSGKPEIDFVVVVGLLMTFHQLVVPKLLRVGIPPNAIAAFRRELDPYKLHGTSLRMALERARRFAVDDDSSDDSSFLLDAEHVLFAPYVDLCFVDKRTFAFLDQERTGERKDLIAPGAAGAIRFAPDLTRVLAEIEKAASETR